jgi:hypothetical protein
LLALHAAMMTREAVAERKFSMNARISPANGVSQRITRCSRSSETPTVRARVEDDAFAMPPAGIGGAAIFD